MATEYPQSFRACKLYRKTSKAGGTYFTGILRSRWSDFKDERSVELSGAVGGDPVKLVVTPLEAGL
jgi:hypothetical protein